MKPDAGIAATVRSCSKSKISCFLGLYTLAVSNQLSLNLHEASVSSLPTLWTIADLARSANRFACMFCVVITPVIHENIWWIFPGFSLANVHFEHMALKDPPDEFIVASKSRYESRCS